ncbi:MAG: hypothetical protein AABX37_06225 [Nanoarchaeota archaeon]
MQQRPASSLLTKISRTKLLGTAFIFIIVKKSNQLVRKAVLARQLL